MLSCCCLSSVCCLCCRRLPRVVMSVPGPTCVTSGKKVFAQGSGKAGRSQQGVTRNLNTTDTDPHYPCAALLMNEDEYINHHCKKNWSKRPEGIVAVVHEERLWSVVPQY